MPEEPKPEPPKEPPKEETKKKPLDEFREFQQKHKDEVDAKLKAVEERTLGVEKELKETREAFEKSVAKTLDQVDKERVKMQAEPPAAPSVAPPPAVLGKVIYKCPCGAEFTEADKAAHFYHCPGCGAPTPFKRKP